MKWSDIEEAEQVGRKIERGEKPSEEETLRVLLILLLDFKRRMED